jgi:hypothetical protein
MLETLNQTSMDPTDRTSSGQSGSNPDISQEEQAEVKAIMKKFHQWKRVRDKHAKDWISFYKLYRGVQWSTQRPSWKTSEIVNFIWQVIQSQLPLQMDARPKFTFLPQEPEDLAFSQIINKVCDAEWTENNWMMTVQEVILDGYIFGTGFSSVNYDPSLLYGMGATVYQSEEPLYCYPDPECNDINDSKSQGFFKAYPVPTDRLKAKYPHRASMIKSDISIDRQKRDKYDLNRRYLTEHASTTMQMPEITYDTQNVDECAIPKTMVFEAYLKPVEMIEDVEQNGDEKIYTVKKKYPKGRYVCIANGMMLHDGELPYEDLEIPYQKYINSSDPRQFFGISEVEQLASPQIIINKILSYTIDVLLYTSNPIWVVDNSADVDTDALNNIPGSVVEKSPGSEVRRENGPPLNPGFTQTLDRLIGWFNDIAGSSDFSRGEATGGVTAASAIEQLISASRTRIRQRMRNMDCYLRGVGRHWLNRVLQFYTAPRIFRMTNEDGSQYFLKMHVDNVQDQQGNPAKQATIQKYEVVDGLATITDTQKLILKGELDSKVTAGSDLPFEAADKERRALALFDRQIIDAQEVLDSLNYPNKEQILQRMSERQAQMVQQQAAAAQQQGA